MKEKEKEIWDTGFVLAYDSSSLLDFYFFPKKTREIIYNQTLTKVNGQLWIPNHVYKEYLRNRKGVIKKPINNSYHPLRKHLDSVENNVAKISNLYTEIHNQSRKPDKLPHLDEAVTEKYSEIVDKISDIVDEFNGNLISAIDDAAKEIYHTLENDDHFEKVNELFNIGRNYSFPELMEIVKEGEIRYRNLIPPGYKDLNDKDGIQKYGDLIIWKQILEYVGEKENNLILVINDQKEDWVVQDKEGNYFPRWELEYELKSKGGKNLWLYTQTDFIRAANNVLETKIEEDEILSIEEYLSQKIELKEDLFLSCKCEKCGRISNFARENLFIEFESVGSYERNMGAEIEYVANLHVPCKYCDNEFEITYDAWEYPIGALNYTDIEAYECEVIEAKFPKVPMRI